MNKIKGFTLIEVAIALVIIGLLISGGTYLYGQQYTLGKVNKTREQLDHIHEVMLTFVKSNGFLPCPDTDGDGLENRNSDGACRSRQGRLPARTLGIDGEDAWGSPFYYRVNARAEDRDRVTDICQSASVFGAITASGVPRTKDSDFAMCPDTHLYYCRGCSDVCGSLCDVPEDPNDPASQPDPRPNLNAPPYFHTSTRPVSSENDGFKNLTIKSPQGDTLQEVVVAVVVSFGRNGLMTWGSVNANTPSCPLSLTSDERENCDNNTTFIDGHKAIDDYLVGITLREVKQAAIEAGYPKY
ncbi:type II secretion system protein [Galenea microaerophila]